MNSNQPSPGVEVGRHPSWCSRQLCITDERDTYHASAPTSLTTDGAMWEGALLRRVDLAHPQEVEPAQLRIDVTDLDLLDQDVQVVVLVEDLPRIAQWLLAQHERATFPPEATS